MFLDFVSGDRDRSGRGLPQAVGRTGCNDFRHGGCINGYVAAYGCNCCPCPVGDGGAHTHDFSHGTVPVADNGTHANGCNFRTVPVANETGYTAADAFDRRGSQAYARTGAIRL